MHTISFALRGIIAGWLAVAPLVSSDVPTRGSVPMELAGFHAMEKSVSVILAERETKAVSSWMRVGQEWRGVRVVRIDEKGESVVLTKGAESWVVPLRKSRVEEGATSRKGGPSGFTLLRGEVTWTEETWVYSTDAVVQFGQAVLSAMTGVMIVEGDTIRGHLAIDSVDGRSIEADEATARVVEGKPILTAGRRRIMFSRK